GFIGSWRWSTRPADNFSRRRIHTAPVGIPRRKWGPAWSLHRSSGSFDRSSKGYGPAHVRTADLKAADSDADPIRGSGRQCIPDRVQYLSQAPLVSHELNELIGSKSVKFVQFAAYSLLVGVTRKLQIRQPYVADKEVAGLDRIRRFKP